jgi:hypothetical protein
VIYRFLDQITHTERFFDDADDPNARETAEAARAAAAEAYLLQEAHRFPPINHVVIDAAGNHTWRPATDADPNEGEYRVFNHITGQNENYSTLSSAKVRLEMLKHELLKMGHLDQLQELNEMPSTVESRHYEHMRTRKKDVPPDFEFHPYESVTYDYPHEGQVWDEATLSWKPDPAL